MTYKTYETGEMSVRPAVSTFSKPRGSDTAGPTSMTIGMYLYILWIVGKNF